MNLETLLSKLTRLGLAVHLEGGDLKVKLLPGATPDPQEVAAALAALRRRKAEVVALLKALVRCQDCEQAEVGRGNALCSSPQPWDGIPGQCPDTLHPCPSFQSRSQPVELPPPAPSCTLCPWCLDNPWSHYPDLPRWCAWWWDYLAANSGWCRDKREGRVPEPQPRSLGKELERGKSRDNALLSTTCYACAHFQTSSGPNPAQAWGFCANLGQGRYGVARVCDAFAEASRQGRSKEASRERERAC